MRFCENVIELSAAAQGRINALLVPSWMTLKAA